MSDADVLVTIRGGVAEVTVNKKEVVVEVRDYDIDDEDSEFTFLDLENQLCWRYFVEH